MYFLVSEEGRVGFRIAQNTNGSCWAAKEDADLVSLALTTRPDSPPPSPSCSCLLSTPSAPQIPPASRSKWRCARMNSRALFSHRAQHVLSIIDLEELAGNVTTRTSPLNATRAPPSVRPLAMQINCADSNLYVDDVVTSSESLSLWQRVPNRSWATAHDVGQWRTAVCASWRRWWFPWKTATRSVEVWLKGKHLVFEVDYIRMKGLSIKTKCAWR